jgi:hypothetical protein
MSQFKSKSQFRNYLYNKEKEFRTIHDLADGAKHYELSRKTTILDTNVSNWKSISNYSKSLDDSSQLFLTIEFDNVGLTMSFDDLLYVITFFWYQFFKDNCKEDVNSLFHSYTWF